MREELELLNRRWIIKRQDPEMYFKIKDRLEELRIFFREKCGYQIIINPLLVKLEKVPGKAESWMGIETFEEQRDYILLTLVLMFLEEMENETQFVLGQLTEYISDHSPKFASVDWTVYGHRRSLIRVIRFCVEEGMIVVTDGDDRGFSLSEMATEVLYENTGASKYFMRRFNFELGAVKSAKELEEMEWLSDERDRGLVRRHRVYRKLILSPVVYDEGEEDADYLYIKNQRGIIESDMEKHLDMSFHLHKNGALAVAREGMMIQDRFPDRKNISDIVLQLCALVRDKAEAEGWKRQPSDAIVLSGNNWYRLVETLRNELRSGWSKRFREETTVRQLLEEINETMESFNMIEIRELSNEVVLLPVIGKMVGKYPEDYEAKQFESEEPEDYEAKQFEREEDGTLEG